MPALAAGRGPAEPASALALAGQLVLLTWLPLPPWLRASRRALCRIAGARRSGSSRHGNAAASECQQRHRERDSCSDCQGTAGPGPGARRPSPAPLSPAHPRPLAALTSTSCSVRATLRKEKRCQRWWHRGGAACRKRTWSAPTGAGHHQNWGPPPAERLSCHGKPSPRSMPCPGTPRPAAPGARPFYLCRPSLSSTESSPGKLSSGSSRVSASAGWQ